MLSVVNDDGTTANGSSLIDEIVREGTRRMPAAALETEVNACIAELADQRDENWRRLVVRNGYHQPRKVTTAAGAVEMKFRGCTTSGLLDEDRLLRCRHGLDEVRGPARPAHVAGPRRACAHGNA